MSQAGTVEADIDIQGDVSGQIVAGNYNVLIQKSSGIVVYASSSTGQPMYSKRPTPIDWRPRSFPSLLDRHTEYTTAKAALQRHNHPACSREKG